MQVRREIEVIQRAINPKPEEDWKKRGEEIQQLLREREGIFDAMKQTMTKEQLNEAA